MTVVPMRDSTTDGLMFVRPIPQGSAPPDLGAFWTDEYGWLVPDTRLQDIANAYQAWKEWMMAGQRDETFEPAKSPEPSVFVLLDALIEENTCQ